MGAMAKLDINLDGYFKKQKQTEKE